MVRDAQEHAEEDKKRREVVDTRNDADQLAFQAERTLRDLGDKVSAEDRADVEAKVTTLREALKGDDMEALRARMSELAASLQKVSTAAYQASAPSGGNGDGTGGDGAADGGEAPESEPAGAAAGGGEDEAVEGEFKEV
jgi:molecular chaperone DnaK